MPIIQQIIKKLLVFLSMTNFSMDILYIFAQSCLVILNIMLWRPRYYHRFTLAEREAREEKSACVVQNASRLLALVLMICLMLAMSMACFKPWKELRQLEHKKTTQLAKLERTKLHMEQAQNNYLWLTQDPQYFETISRDKGNLALPGETIYRIEEPQRLK